MQEEPQERLYPARKWVKRTGIVAFIFFLGKGLLWLGALVLGAYYYTIN
jgi:hypothetical protein